VPRLTSFDGLTGDLVDDNNTLDHKKAIKNTTREPQRTEMRFLSSNVCNTSERLLLDGRVMCIGPYHHHGVSVGKDIYKCSLQVSRT